MKKKVSKKPKFMGGFASAVMKGGGPAALLGDVNGILKTYGANRGGEEGEKILDISNKVDMGIGAASSVSKGIKMSKYGQGKDAVSPASPEAPSQKMGADLGSVTKDKMIDIPGAGKNWAPGSMNGMRGSIPPLRNGMGKKKKCNKKLQRK